MASKNIHTIRRFCDAFSRRDPDEILGYFTDDAIYHNMPMPPVQGKTGIKTVLDMFLKASQSAEFIILKIAEGEDGSVLTERLDKFALGGKKIELPVMGAFELTDGKIAAWRDYFDMAAWTCQTTGA